MKALLLLLLICLSETVIAQSSARFSITSSVIAGGGTTFSGSARFQLGNTVGQPDAGGPVTGSGYSLTGGFWSQISVVQTPGLPNLAIAFTGPDSVVVSWPDTGSFTLQQNSNLAVPGGWTASGFSISTANGTNSVIITPPAGNLFFRLSSP
jgi:hypothetical protein